jgi:signal transduction histidine kinase
MTYRDTLLRWLPADCLPGMRQRLTLVVGVTLLVAVYNWLTGSPGARFDESLVYSFAISLAIWGLSDPLRIALRRWYGAHHGPHYWFHGPRTSLHMALSIVLGYAIGTAIGNAYTGHEPWQLIAGSPQRFWSIGLFTVLLALGFNLYFQQRGTADSLRREAAEARLKLLETQLEPHMLFNTLANLRVLIQTDPPRAVAMLDRLGDYLRATLRGSRADAAAGTHTLADEFARLGDYLELMAVRMGPRLAFGFDLPDGLRSHPVPPLLLQPLVENAIRHGLEPRVEGGRIDVSARQEGPSLRIDVTDSGVGMAPDAHRPDTEGGFGMAQVRERVASLPGGSGAVQVTSRPGQGTTVRLTLPFQSNP